MRGSSPQGSPVSQTMPSQLFLALADVFKPVHTTCSNASPLQPWASCCCSRVSERSHRAVWYIVISSPALLISTMENYGKMSPSVHTFIPGHPPQADEDESRTEAWMCSPTLPYNLPLDLPTH